MDETSDQIERHIQEKRNDLGDNFNELGDKVKKAVDWRAQVEERPGTMLGLAFAGGVILSAVLPSGRRSRSTYAGSESPQGEHAWSPARPSSTPPASKPSEARQSVDALAGALISVAANKASRFIDSLMPGFEREFSSARAASKSAAYSRSDSGSLVESHAQLKSSAAEAD